MKKVVYSLLAFVFLLLSLPTFAQSSRGAVTGTVKDAAGAVLPNAEVTLTSPATGVALVEKTNGAGIYRFESVRPDEYKVRVAVSGFTTQEQAATVVVGALVGRDFTLSVSSVSTAVDVVSEKSAELQTEDAVRGGTISSNALVELPISGENSLNLILTLPGVARSNTNTANDNGIGSVNGARGRSNNFLIDGLLNNDISVTGTQFTITNNDELQEVTFQTSNFSAEYGRAGGAVTTQVTKSGTNKIHGTLAEVYYSEIFNASTNTQRINFNNGSTAVLKPKYKENVPAFTIGGPVFIPHLYDGHDKTFFFGGGQWDRYSSGASQASFTVPTAAGYTTLSMLSAKCPNVAKYLAALGDARGSSGVGAASIDISVPNSLSATTCDGTDRANTSVQTGTYIRSAQNTNLDNNHLIRLDHNPSQRQNMTFRWLWDNDVVKPQVIGINPNFDVTVNTRTMGALFADTYSIKSNLVNEFRFGYTRSALNFPLAPGPALTLPTLSVAGLTSLAASSSYPQGRTANSYQYQDVMTWVKGRHAIRGGVEILRQLANQSAPINSRGTYTYIASPINAAAGVTAPIQSLANFIDDVGGPGGGATISIGNSRYHPNLFSWTLYLQDTYKPTSNLTLTYGLRYENFGQPANIFKYPAFAGTGDTDITNPVKVNPDNNNFGPSVGFSYNPHATSHGPLSGSTVIRGGYQVSYDTFYNNLLSNINTGIPNTLTNAPITSVSNATTPRGYVALSAAPITAAPLTPYSAVSSQFAKNIRNPYYHHFSLGIQQQFPGRVVLDVAYVGTQGRQLLYSNYLNPRLPNAALTTYATQTTALYGTQYLTFYPNRGQIIIRQSGANSNYNSLQAQLRRQNMHTIAGDFSFTSSYTFSKSLSVVDDPISSSYASSIYASRPQVIAGPLVNYDYGPSDLDIKHVSSTVIQWHLPEPKNRLLKLVAGGWVVSPILTVQSGQPFSVLNGADRDLDGASANDRPNIGNRKAPLNTRGVVTPTSNCSTGYYDPAKQATGAAISTACVDPTTVHFLQVPTYSLAGVIEGRNENYTTRYLTLDTDLLKRFTITERVKAELRGVFFNVTNNQNFTTPSAPLNVSSLNGTNFQNFLLGSGGGRTFHVAGKITF